MKAVVSLVEEEFDKVDYRQLRVNLDYATDDDKSQNQEEVDSSEDELERCDQSLNRLTPIIEDGNREDEECEEDRLRYVDTRPRILRGNGVAHESDERLQGGGLNSTEMVGQTSSVEIEEGMSDEDVHEEVRDTLEVGKNHGFVENWNENSMVEFLEERVRGEKVEWEESGKK